MRHAGLELPTSRPQAALLLTRLSLALDRSRQPLNGAEASGVAASAPPLRRLGTASAPRKEVHKEFTDAPRGEDSRPEGGRPAPVACCRACRRAGRHHACRRAPHRAALPCAVPPGAMPDAELPAGWCSATDERGRLYYYHRATKHTQWHADLLIR